MRRFLIIITIIALAAVSTAWYFRVPLRERWDEVTAPELPAAVEVGNDKLQIINDEEEDVDGIEPSQGVDVEDEATIPAEINIAVPFTTQSPYAKWTEQDEESCEEAAILMAYHWQQGTSIKNADQATRELQEVVDFENATLGFYKDTTAAETRQIMLELWDVAPEKVVLTEEVTVERIIKELAAGNLVLVPTYGRGLGNPNFKRPGPLYHFLVIKGYTEKYFITNDPGTRKGADYVYTYDVLLNAVHDWNGGAVEAGEKVMLVASK